MYSNVEFLKYATLLHKKHEQNPALKKYYESDMKECQFMYCVQLNGNKNNSQ
jgi:hypothetical protein